VSSFLIEDEKLQLSLTTWHGIGIETALAAANPRTT